VVVVLNHNSFRQTHWSALQSPLETTSVKVLQFLSKIYKSIAWELLSAKETRGRKLFDFVKKFNILLSLFALNDILQKLLVSLRIIQQEALDFSLAVFILAIVIIIKHETSVDALASAFRELAINS